MSWCKSGNLFLRLRALYRLAERMSVLDFSQTVLFEVKSASEVKGAGGGMVPDVDVKIGVGDGVSGLMEDEGRTTGRFDVASIGTGSTMFCSTVIS